MDDHVMEQLLSDLDEAATRVGQMVRAAPPLRWQQPLRDAEGGWSRRELLAHLAANDLRQLVRIRVGAGLAEPSDPAALEAEQRIDSWNKARVEERAGQSVEQLLAEMRRNRDQLLALLRSLTPRQREEKMPFLGRPVPLTEMIPAIIAHLDGHAREFAG